MRLQQYLSELRTLRDEYRRGGFRLLAGQTQISRFRHLVMLLRDEYLREAQA